MDDEETAQRVMQVLAAFDDADRVEHYRKLNERAQRLLDEHKPVETIVVGVPMPAAVSRKENADD